MWKFGFLFQFYFVVIQVPKDPVKDERTVTIQRVLDQEKAFWKVNNNYVIGYFLSFCLTEASVICMNSKQYHP